MQIDPHNIDETEFAVSLRGGEVPCYVVPIAEEVQDLLKGMLTQTLTSIQAAGDISEIEYGEAYGPHECVRCPIDDPTVARIAQLFTAQNPPTRAAALNNPALIDYYLAKYTDSRGHRCMGVKTPNQFKGSIGKKLIRLLGDELVVVHDHLFKLDNEFDFLVDDVEVVILNPNQFMRVADVDAVLAEATPRYMQSIAASMPVVDFATTTAYAISHSRAQKLVASIRKRPELGQVTLPRLQSACASNNIPTTLLRGKLAPDAGHEIDFLELLDGRRYIYPLEENNPELLRALRRTRVRS